ncbi:MAG: AsmA family protein [Acetobacteraceae bacterium]|nr:AsmA family protein [Acetobacteraceae bacterium]
MAHPRTVKWVLALGIPAAIIVALVFLWSWDWFIPIVEARASSALGRSVTIGHLHLALGSPTRITADDVTIDNPPEWHGPPFARAKHLVIEVRLWDYLRHRQLVLPLVSLQGAQVDAVQAADGRSNYQLQLASSSSGSETKIGDIRIEDSHVNVQLAKLKADMKLDVSTREEGDQSKVVIAANGTYGAAPISGEMVGGALLSLRDPSHPWPVDLHLENGQTKVSLTGTLQEPLHLKGADLKLQFSGQDMAELEPLTGIPVPKTPPYTLTGQLDFANQHVQFRDFRGRVGNSDLEGNISVDPGPDRPQVEADLQSRRVDLADLGGFIGTTPGRVSTPGQTPAKRAEVAQAEATSKFLPQKPIHLPHLQWADIHLRYRGQKIQGESMPLDNLSVALDIENGRINIHPVSFGVGSGQIKMDVELTPMPDNVLRAKADLEFQRLDVSRMMAATHAFHGAGTISGTGNIDATGNSMAQLLANGNGGIRLGMAGGDLSALLVDLSGLQLGNALLSALGIPQKTPIECLVDDMALQSGVLRIQALVVDTGEGIINGAGSVDLRDEKLDLALKTEAKHFTIGSLPTPIHIGGSLKSPGITPGPELAARAAAAGGLAALFPPLALLPTIQFGVGDDHRCDRLLAQAKSEPGGQRLPSPKDQQTNRR